MPIFELNGQRYNVEDQYIDAFSSENPDASTIEERNGQQYRVRAKDYRNFLSSFDSDDASGGGKTITGGVGTQAEADSLFDLNYRRFNEKDPNKRAALEMEYNNLENRLKEREMQEIRDNLETNGEIKRLQEIQGRAQLAIDKASFFDRFFDADTRAAVAARNQAEEALEIYEEAKHANEGWFDKNVLGVFRGIGDKIGDLSTWDFGASGVASGYALKNVSDKLDRGEQLTAAEQNMLDAFGLASAVQTAYQDKVGMAYKAGGSLPESAAFMGSLMFNPAAGIGRKIAESAAKAAVKKFGTSMVSKLAKGAARVGGDALEMAVATAVPGAGRVAEDYYNRLNGQSTFDIDENGIIRYGGQVEQEEADDAIWKAFGSQFIENYSESVGNYFAPMGTMLSNLTSKGLKAAHLGKLADVVNDISSSQFSRGLKRFKDATKFDGFVGEYLEEVAGNFMNAATVGDMNFNSPEDPRSVFNPEVNMETALSCALMSGTMYAVEAPVSIYNRRVAKKNLSEADKAASELWGDRWDDMRSQMDEADPQLLAQLLTGINNATDLSDEAKQAAKNYATRLMQMQGYNARRLQNQMESTEEANAINNAYDEDAELETPYDKHNAKRAVDRAEAALGVGSENSDEQQFAQMVMAGANSPVETINAMAEQGYLDEQIQKAKDYYTAYHRMNGLTDALLDNVNSQTESANKEVDANTNKDNGSVTKVVLRDGRTGYIVEGTVVRGEKGIVDVNNSDETVMVRLENGEVKMMNPNKDLYGVAWIDSPENVKEEINVVLREKLIDKAIGEIDWNPATPNPKVGDSFEMEGVPLTIVSHDGNGGMFVVPTEEYQSAVGNEKKMQELIAKAQQTQPIPASEYKNWASAQLDAQEEAAKVQQEVVSGESVGEQVNAGVNVPVNTGTQQPVAEKRPMTEDEAALFIFQMERNAVEAPEIELTPENWIAEFGEDGLVETPIGQVKFGRNQYVKLRQMGRRGKLGMIKPTLTEPDVIVEDKRPSKDGSEERDFSYVFIKAFIGKDGKRMYYFTSVTIKKGGSEVVISNQEKSLNKISRLLQGGNVVWTNPLFSSHPTTRIEESVPLNDSNKPTSTDNQSAWLGINSSELSTNKDSYNNVQSQKNKEKPLHEREKEDVFRELGEKYGEKMPHKVEVTAKALADDLKKAQEKLDILRNPLNGMQEVLEAVEVSLENKVKTRAIDAAIKNEPKKEPTNPSGNKLVSEERYAELRERMRKKLGGQMNIGIDPEILAIGTEMAVYHIEKGARKFAEYAKAMIADLGDAIRPYLKAFYNGARDLPEMQNEGFTSEMTPYEEVSSFDVANFDKASIDVVAAVETIAKELEVKKQAEVAKVRVKKQSKPKKKTKENVSLLGDLFNQNIEENESNDDGRGNRQKASGTLPTNGGRKHVASTTGNQTTDESLGSQPRKENSQSDRRGFDTGMHGRDVSDENGSDRVHGSTIEQPVKKNARNFSFGKGHIEVPSGDVAKLKANIAAIRTLKEIEASGQPATDEKKAVLAKYVGWGGLSAALDEQKFLNSKGWMADRNWNEKYLPYYKELRELLTKEEFNDAVQSTLTSHYTPEEIIRGMWNVVERMGFKGGRINEPAAGIGHILGLMPSSISERSVISGTELDSLSGRIAKALYPDANIKVQGYEKEFAPKSKDLVITNVPFGKTAPYDKALDKALHKKMGSAYNLHNYFIAKGLLELKEGGIGVFVTSSATMDGANSKFREWVAANGIDLIGAIRLPNNAFLKNAGTSVTADMLVFRKRKSGEPSNGVDFVSTTQVGEGNYVENGKTHTKPIMINEYFAEHPEMMLGEMMTAHDAGSGGLYSGSSQTCVAEKGADLGKELQNAILRLDAIDGNLSESQNPIATEEQEQTTDLKNGTLVVKGDDVLIAINGELQSIATKKEFTFNGKKQKTAHAVRDYIALKETLKSLIAAEQSSTENPEPIRKKLNKEYDAFVAKYGTLNRNKALDDVLAEDFEHNLPLSLENVKRVPSATGKSMVWEVTKSEGILSKRVSFPVEEPTKAENLDDAIHISRSYRGVIDVPYVAALLGQTEEEVTNDMLQEGLAYRNPITGNLEDKESYLSGNVKEKLEQARAMAKEHPEYQKNVEDLAEVQPETVRFGDISYRIGTPWIPTEYVNDFASEVLGVRSVDVQYVSELNEFVVSKSARVDDFVKSGQFRTDRVGVIDLLEYALNQRKPKIFDKHVSYGPMGKVEERVPNEAETQAAAEKIMEISDKFIEYIDGRSNIHRELERIYNDKYNNYRLKTYELPSFSKMEKDKDDKDVLATHYPNSNVSISLREHQAKAVQRCLSESTLLAHQVGTGKTFTMITAAMEMRRLGIANKPMIVVQNATLEDFVKDFYKLYPGANVLAPGKDERSAENRKRLFNLIATGDFDAIVIPQSFMQFIPDDEGRKKELIQKRIEEYERALEKIEDYSLQKRMQKEIDSLRDTLEGKEKKRSVKDSAKSKERIKAKVEKTLDRRTDEVLTFEQMGIDALFIDEAHNYKKIGFASKMSNVKGIDTSASQRANSLLLKAQYVQEKNGGRNVILATGTPITNTMAEVWTMMKFVSPEILETYNIQGFDDFATTFGTVEPSLEFTATGNFKIADRFKSYVNVPELVKAFRSHADVVLTSDVKEFKESNNIPKLKDDQMTNVVIEKNEDLEDVMNILIKKLEEYNEMSGSEKREWSALPLVVFSRAKQAAIDLRLLNPSYEDNPNSKTNHVVRNVLKLYQESTPEKGAQMIFCDSYQSPGEAPKMDLFDYDPDVPRFNLYEDIKKKLVEGGIPANEIAIVNNYDGERRKQLFEKVRNGDVRVLLGSTEKMGVGVNVQDRMFALHHIDAPIRPMDFEQRNGRILRQGNLYATWGKPVNVVTYGVQGTLDATAYDRLRVKQDFINQMMKGDVSGRIMEEQDEEDPSGMTFNQMAATLSGDKTAQLLFVAENELKKLRNLKRSDFNSKSGMGMTIQSEERRLVGLNDKLELWGKAKEITSKYFPEGVTQVKVNGETFTEKFGPSLDPVIENYEEAYSLNRGTAPLKISLNNGNGEVIVHFDEGKMVYELYAGKEHVVESRQFNGGKGLMSSIEHQLKATEKNYNETKQKIAETKSKIKGLEKAMNAPWGREKDLKKKELEVADLKKKLEEKALENSKNRPVEQPKNEVAVDSEEEVLYRPNANFRSGQGVLTTDEVSMANDPIGKVLGYSTRTASERKTFAERERVRMVQRVNSLAKKLGLKNVEIVLDGNTLKGKKAKAKGFYSRTNRKITIVISNHTSAFDVEQTLLHEAVAHYGLRELFGPQFEVFLDNVYRHAASDVRERINRLAEKNGWDFQTATEEYLASLAEDTNFENMDESWWNKIKQFFLDMLHQIGFTEFSGVTLTDNELRYILWRSYENLAEPGSRRSIFGEAADVVMQDKLKVGNYSYSKYERERDRLLATGRTNSRVAEGDAYTYTPEDIIQEFEEVVANHPDIYAVRTEEDIDALPTDRYTKRDIKAKFNNPRVTGTHVEGGMMILFVDRMDEAELRATIPHELAHFASRNLKIDEFYKMSALDYLRKNYSDEYQKVVDSYAKEKWGEEAVSNLFEKKVEELGFEKILNSKFDSRNDIGYIFYQITNFLNYGKRRGIPGYRKGLSGQSNTGTESEARGISKEKGVFGNAGLRVGKETEGSVSGNDGRRTYSELGAVPGASMGERAPSRGQKEVEDELYRIDDEVEGMADNAARKLYEDSVKGKGYRFQEGFQDSMLALKKLQEAIVKQHGGKLEEWEDAYTAENQMSSRDTAEIENFVFNHFKPMMKEVANVLKRGGMTYEELRTYLFAKSGLERNRDFAVRDAIAQREKDGDDVSGIYEAYMQRKQELLQDLKDGTISFREYCEEMDNEAMMIAPDLIGKDYSGLSSLFSEDNFTEDAIAEVESVEDLVDTSDLWNVIKGATQFTLDRAKQSGVMNTDVHKKLSEMFKWYIPMRGWSETKARDVYEYFGSQEGVFNPSVKNAYGRKSLADDPLATISNMAESAIFQGNRNQMKQKLLNLAFDKPTNLITVMDSWIENKGTDTDPRWEYVYPTIEEDDDADVIAAKIKLFEEEMEQKKNEGRAKKLRGKADIPYIATPKEIAEHIIRVKRNGREFVMILNGNPRAAKAVNGMTNPETYNGIIEQVSRRLNKFMAAVFTTKNPTFIMRNLSRDLIFSNTVVAVKENTIYGKKFRGNQLKVLGNMRGLMKRYQLGNLDMSNELDKMFMEFIKNGGETGFAQLTSVDEYKKKIQRELNIAKNGGAINKGKKVGRAVMDTIEFYNRCAEDVSRFTVFMTSRQMGRSIQRSISDAKEITVNFNKRGSGSKAGGFIGFGAQSMRSLYLFFNAAVQALVNFKRLGWKHPVAFTSALSMYAVSGFLMPVVNEFLSSILGGDDDDYENLPEWVRRNNLVISLGKWGGDSMFLTIPLPIEMRAFYGLGETANQMMAGNVRGKDAAWQIAGQFAEMLPLNFVTDAAGPWNAFTPDAFKPIVQAYITNKDWTGKPIYRDNGFNKELPEWTKAYTGTSKWLVNSAELMNELTGGDKYKSGVVDANPARLEHLFTGYLGGFGDMFLGAYKTLSMPFDEDYRNVRHVPVLKAFFNQSDERTSYAQVKKDYASYKNEYEDTVRRLNGYEKEMNRPETAMEYAERMDFLYRSPQMKRYEFMREYERELSKMYKMMQKYPDSDIQKSIMVSINQLKANAVERLRNIE